jgi:hypothetical protein
VTLPDTSSRPGPDPRATDAQGSDAPAATARKVDGRPPTVGPGPAAPKADAPVVPPAVEPAPPTVEPAPSPAGEPMPLAASPSAVARASARAEAAPAAPPTPVVEDEPVAAEEPRPDEPLDDDPVVEAAPIPVADGSGLPVPPCPPFEPAPAPYRWQVRLPGSGTGTFVVRVGDDRMWVDGVDVPYAAIADVELGIEKDKATVTRRKAANTFLTLTLRDGSVVAGSARDVGRSRGGVESVVAATVYLWSVLGTIPAIRERRGIEEKLRRGAEVAIGHLRITAIGVAWKRNPIATWSTLGDPTLRGTDMIVPTEGEPLVVPLDVDDAFMLPTLIPELRRCFG